MSCSKEDEEDGLFAGQLQHFDIWFLLMRTRNPYSFSLLLGRQANASPGLPGASLGASLPAKPFDLTSLLLEVSQPAP